MSEHQRRVPKQLRLSIELAAKLLSLPLTALQLEALALELTGPVRALIAEALADVGDDSPVRYAVAESAGASAEFEVTEYAGCTSAVGLEVDLDSPAAVLAHKLRSTQYDVVSTEVPDAHTMGITVRPGSIDCWRWWMQRLGVDPQAVATDGSCVTGTGQYKGVTVHLRGQDVPELLTDLPAARLMGVIAESKASA